MKTVPFSHVSVHSTVPHGGGQTPPIVSVPHIQRSKGWGSKDCHCAYSFPSSDIVSPTKAQILICKRMAELRSSVRRIYIGVEQT